MNLVVAFAVGALLGAAAAVAVCWHLIRSARAAFREAEDAEMSAKNRCDALADELERNRFIL